MLNRKESKSSNGAVNHSRGRPKPAPAKARPRRRVIISAKAAGRVDASARPPQNGTTKASVPAPNGLAETKPATPGAPPSPIDLAETIKTLLHLAHENGHITYDDINDVLPDGLSPDDLD